MGWSEGEKLQGRGCGRVGDEGGILGSSPSRRSTVVVGRGVRAVAVRQGEGQGGRRVTWQGETGVRGWGDGVRFQLGRMDAWRADRWLARPRRAAAAPTARRAGRGGWCSPRRQRRSASGSGGEGGGSGGGAVAAGAAGRAAAGVAARATSGAGEEAPRSPRPAPLPSVADPSHRAVKARGRGVGRSSQPASVLVLLLFWLLFLFCGSWQLFGLAAFSSSSIENEIPPPSHRVFANVLSIEL